MRGFWAAINLVFAFGFVHQQPYISVGNGIVAGLLLGTIIERYYEARG